MNTLIAMITNFFDWLTSFFRKKTCNKCKCKVCSCKQVEQLPAVVQDSVEPKDDLKNQTTLVSAPVDYEKKEELKPVIEERPKVVEDTVTTPVVETTAIVETPDVVVTNGTESKTTVAKTTARKGQQPARKPNENATPRRRGRRPKAK